MFAKLAIVCLLGSALAASVLEFQDGAGTCTMTKNGNIIELSTDCDLNVGGIDTTNKLQELEGRIVALEQNSATNPVDTCEDLRMRGISASGVYPLNTNSGVVNTKCLYKDGKMWTMVYKIGTGSAMKTTGQENPSALVTPSNTNDSGKLSDSDIRRLCNGQYYMKQSGITSLNAGSLYCKFDDINSFADNVIVNKKCGFNYVQSGAYTAAYNSASWAWNFGSWGQSGAIITQLNYRDSRKGSHVCYSCSAGGDGSCTGSGGCDTEVYCLKSTPVDSCEELRNNGITASGVYPINTNNGIVNTKCLYKDGRMWTLTYKIGTGSNMKTTGSTNLAALATASNTNDSGKMADTDIRRLCAGQYYMKQSGITSLNAGSLYCKFDNINAFADNVIMNKKCAFSYVASGGYTTAYNSGSWAWNFGSWGQSGAIITQLNYRDSRKGSHVCYSCSAGGDGSCTGSGGCDTEVYCLE